MDLPQIVQLGLRDGQHILPDSIDAPGINLYASHIVAKFGQTPRRDEAHMTGSNYTDSRHPQILTGYDN